MRHELDVTREYVERLLNKIQNLIMDSRRFTTTKQTITSTRGISDGQKTCYTQEFFRFFFSLSNVKFWFGAETAGQERKNYGIRRKQFEKPV